MNSGANEIEDIEPTICQIFRDIFGIGSEYTKKADKIQNAFIVPSSVKMMYGQATKEQYREEKFKMYRKLISQAEAYVMVEGMDDGTIETSKIENLKTDEHSIFPAIIDTNIYSMEEQIKYVRYWEKRVEILKKNLMGLGYTNGLALGQELKKSEDIARCIAEFLVNIADMKNPDINNIHEAIYQRIKTYV